MPEHFQICFQTAEKSDIINSNCFIIMKKNLFLGAVLIAAIGLAKAQTDVTSTYLQNPGFELSAKGTNFNHTGATDVSGGLYGWTLGSKDVEFHDIQVCDNTYSASGFGTQVAPAEGNYYFFNRKGWATITWSLSTTASELPAGKYFFTVDYKAAESQNSNGYKEGKMTIDVLQESETLATSGAEVVTCYNPGNTYFNTSPWKTKGIWFTVDATSTITIQITEYLNGNNGRSDICLDNCKLYQWSLDDATNYQNASEATPLDMTHMIPNPDFSSNLDGCERTLTYQNNARATNQHGAFSGYFWENWNGSAGAGKMYQTISGLPNGKYRVKLAAFGNNETEGTQGVYLYATGCTGSGTPVTSATPAFYEVDAMVTDGTLEFGLESKSVSNWLGMDNVSLAYLGANLDELTSGWDAYCDAVLARIPENVGDAAFQIPTAAKTTLEAAVTAAKDATFESAAEYYEVKATLDAAWETFINTPFNAPEESQAYYIILDGNNGWTYDTGKIQYTQNDAAQGGYNLAYTVNSISNNEFYFVSVADVTNGYKLKFSAGGSEYYICTGTAYGGNDSQIRVTTDAAEALVIRVEYKNGYYQLYNTAAGNYIGSQDSGVFTVNSHTNFLLTAKPDQVLSVSAETITFKGASSADLTISGQNLTEKVTIALSSPDGLSLSKETLTKEEVSAEGGATVTITCSAALAEAVTLTVSSGDLSKTVTLNTTSSLEAAVAGLFMDQSMSDTYTFAFTKAIFGIMTTTVPEGLTLTEDTENGTMTVTWDKKTLVDGEIVLSAGDMEERIEVLATPANLISTWDGDNAEGDGSKLTDFGWTQTSADGQTEQTPSWQNYNAGSGVRLVPMPDNYTYNGGKLLGHRIAYLRTWGTVDFKPEFVYNLPVTLETGATYKACALLAWHNNGEKPTARVAIRTAKGKGDENLATADKYFTTKTTAQQYEFEFKATQEENYLTIALISTENADGGGYKDCMLVPAYLTIYKTADAPKDPTALNAQQLSDMQVQVEKGMLRVLNVAEFSVYNVQGQQVAACAGNETVMLPQGVYIVKAAGAVRKVLVK